MSAQIEGGVKQEPSESNRSTDLSIAEHSQQEAVNLLKRNRTQSQQTLNDPSTTVSENQHHKQQKRTTTATAVEAPLHVLPSGKKRGRPKKNTLVVVQTTQAAIDKLTPKQNSSGGGGRISPISIVSSTDDTPHWSCTVCTFINYNLKATSCEMCGTV
jgi:hypothetical protein